MRGAVTALAAATRATLALTPVIVALWLAGLVVARLVAEPWAEAFERFVAPAPDARVWLRDWTPQIVDEFLGAEAARIDAAAAASRSAALPWIAAWTVLSGGIVAAVAPCASRGVLRDSLRLAHRFAWLAVVTLAAVGALAWIGAQLDAALTAAGLLDPVRDRTWLLAVATTKTVAQLAALHVVLTVHRLARVRTAVLDERFAPTSWLAAARACARRAPTIVAGSLLAALPLAAAFGWAWRTASDTSPGPSWLGHAPFLAVVAALVFRTAVEAQMWPLYGPVWRATSSPTPRRTPAAAAACAVLAAPVLLLDDEPVRVTRAELLDDVVVAETYVELDARAAVSSVVFTLDGDATVASARIAEAPPDAARPPDLTEAPSLPLTSVDATVVVTLPEAVPAGGRVALSLLATSPRTSASTGARAGAEVLDAIGVRPADDPRVAPPRRAQVVVWSPEDVLVEATGGAGVVGTDGAGRARTTFTWRGDAPVRAVGLPRAAARSTTAPGGSPTLTVVAAPGVMRSHRAVVLEAARRWLSALDIAGHAYPHDHLTLVLDPSASPPRAHGSTWCVVPVSALGTSSRRWVLPLVERLGELTGATSPKLAALLAAEFDDRPELSTPTPDALRAVLATAAASGAWSLRVPGTDLALGPLDALGWWRSPYLAAAPRHAAPLAEPWRLDDTLDALRRGRISAWNQRVFTPPGAGAAIVDARTAGSDAAWTHTVVVERADASIAPDVELLFSDGLEQTCAWPDDATDRWVLERDGRAPLVTATLRFDDSATWGAQASHDDARLATPDHGAADVLTHVATRWNELALWGWAAVF